MLTLSYRIFIAESLFEKFKESSPEDMEGIFYDKGYSNYFLTDQDILLLIDPFSRKEDGDIASIEKQEEGQ